MSSRTTSFDAARKLTAWLNARSVSPLANDSFAPGARSWTISSRAVPSAPAPLNEHAGADRRAAGGEHAFQSIRYDADTNPGAVEPELRPHRIGMQDRVAFGERV